MTRPVEQTRAWVRTGTGTFAKGLTSLTEESAGQATDLPGWTRKHLIAHVAANADALRNLAHWARTGEERPMYSSPDQRNEDIEAGARKPLAELIEWYTRTAAALEEDFDAVTADAWNNEVRTAQGRTVPFTEVPWMRTREVVIHAVDLGTGATFAEFPAGCLAALCDDIAGKRSTTEGNPALELVASDQGGPERGAPDATGTGAWTVDGDGTPVRITAPLAELTAYLSGRPHHMLTTEAGEAAPMLPAWL